MDEAMEWEKSMMSGEITLTGIEEAEEGGEDEETQQNGVQGLQGTSHASLVEKPSNQVLL